MHPLEALGLARDADERAVKRAYAQRLRKARPDEDPAGFQKLHETYQAALSYLRWREENPDGEDFWADGSKEEEAEQEQESGSADDPAPPTMSSAEFEALIGNPRYRPVEQEAARAVPVPAPSPSFERIDQEDEPFRLDFAAFVELLSTEAATKDERGFRAFLVGQTDSLPIGVKEAVGARLLDWLDDDDVQVSPEKFEAIVDVFGLDDVLSGVDPLALAELRERIAYWHEERERAGRISYLLDPQNRDELCRVMRQPEHGGHFGFVTRTILNLLTSSYAYRLAVLLRPVPFLNDRVMRFLRDIDYGRLDMIARHVDARALDFWEWAEGRREANRTLRYVLAIIGLIAGIGYVTRDTSSPSSRSSVRRSTFVDADRRQVQIFAERIRRANKLEQAEGITEYRKLLADLPRPPWTPEIEEVAALVRFNLATILADAGHPTEARALYEEVERLFGRSSYRPAQLVVAYSLVNLGYQSAHEGKDREALVPFLQVIARYGDIKTEAFDIQIAKALSGRSDAFERLGEHDEARHALDDLLRRFGDRKTGKVGELAEKARERRAALDRPNGSSDRSEPPRQDGP